MPGLIRRIEQLEQRAQSHGRGGGPLEFVEVYLSEPLEVREARIAAAEARAGPVGPGGFRLVVVELDDVTEES